MVSWDTLGLSLGLGDFITLLVWDGGWQDEQTREKQMGQGPKVQECPLDGGCWDAALHFSRRHLEAAAGWSGAPQGFLLEEASEEIILNAHMTSSRRRHSEHFSCLDSFNLCKAPIR